MSDQNLTDLYAAYANHCAIQKKVPMTWHTWKRHREGQPEAPWITNEAIKRNCPHCGGNQYLQSKWGVGKRWKDVSGCGREDEA